MGSCTRRMAALLVGVAMSAAACGGGGSGAASSPAANCKPDGTILHETSRNIAFQSACLAAPANTAVTLVFENQDPGVPHNIHIYSADPSKDAAASSLFAGSLVTGPTTKTYHVPALPPGTYFFHCDVHPQQMSGVFVVGG